MTGGSNPPHIDPSDVLDATLHRDKIVFTLRDGTRVIAEKTEYTYKLYWHVKIRNRRVAFGL